MSMSRVRRPLRRVFVRLPRATARTGGGTDGNSIDRCVTSSRTNGGLGERTPEMRHGTTRNTSNANEHGDGPYTDDGGVPLLSVDDERAKFGAVGIRRTDCR